MALSISDVLKVINYPSATSGGLKGMGLVQLGRHTIRVFDWHEEFNASSLPNLPDRQSFLVISRTPQGELCGIEVDEPPNLVELPLEIMRSLPSSERQSPALTLVSHAAVISQKDTTTTIFLLDMKRVPYQAIAYTG